MEAYSERFWFCAVAYTLCLYILLILGRACHGAAEPSLGILGFFHEESYEWTDFFGIDKESGHFSSVIDIRVAKALNQFSFFNEVDVNIKRGQEYYEGDKRERGEAKESAT